MDRVILQNITDVFQIEGRGTVVTGEIGAEWDLAQKGAHIEFLTPDGQKIKAEIKDKELIKRGLLDRQAIPPGGVLLTETIASDRLPRGTIMLML